MCCVFVGVYVFMCVCTTTMKERQRESASALGCMTSVFSKDKESTHKSMHICLSGVAGREEEERRGRKKSRKTTKGIENEH